MNDREESKTILEHVLMSTDEKKGIHHTANERQRKKKTEHINWALHWNARIW